MRVRLSSGTFLAVVVVACCGWLAFYARGATARDVDKVMEREVGRGFSGVVLLKRRGEVIFEHAYGFANAEQHVPNTLDTKFRIGSITKTFTAIVIMQLEGEGKLALADCICSYIEECPPGWADIELHHLLSHTSGIFNYTKVDDTAAMLAAPQVRPQVIARILHEPLAFQPGEKFEYSNSNFWLLGRVIEKVTGQSYEAALTRRIFEPLGLHNTGVAHDWARTPRAATGYWISREGKLEAAPLVDGSWSFADGGIYSTVGDLEKLSDALDRETLLPRSTLERMWTPVKEAYGYGWSTPKISQFTFNRRVVSHGGALPGFLAQFQRVVDDELTLIVLANGARAKPPRVAAELGSIVLGEKFVPSYERESVKLTDEVLQKYAGEYDVDGQIWTLSVREGRLLARSDRGGPEIELVAESDETFFMRDDEGALTAVKNAKGEVTGMMLTGRDTPVLARKVH